MRRLAIIAAALVAAVVATGPARADVQWQNVTYTDGQVVLKGYMAWDDAYRGARPGVLVFHEWWGLNDYAKQRADQLAEMGYVAFAADIYGDGKTAATPDEARKLSGPFRDDRKLMRSRANAAFARLLENKMVDPTAVAAIGFCFGGTCALELARSGADVKATVVFHGGLTTPNTADAKNIRGKILALQGGSDPAAPQKDLVAFMDEMQQAGVDYELNVYGPAKHAFTNPAAGAGSPGSASAYHEQTAARSWAAMHMFLGENIGIPVEESKGEKVVRFTKEYVIVPLETAGEKAGNAIWKAGKATGKALKKAYEWTKEKLE